MAVNTPGGASFSNDPILGLFNTTGTRIALDDDGGPGWDSLISNFTIGSSGFYTAAVSGYSDFEFDGGGSSDWTYQLEVTGLTPESVPEPASILGLLAFGALGAGSVLKGKQQKA